MQKVYKQNGSTLVVVVSLLTVVLLGTLGFVFYQNFIVKKQNSATTTASDTQSTEKSEAAVLPTTSISQSDRSGWLRYTNNALGYQIDFPGQVYGETSCRAANQWYDTSGQLVAAPVTVYGGDEGMADMTILDYPSRGMALITQKRAPQFTNATYGADQRGYFSACTMVDTTPEILLANTNTSKSIAISWRPLQVFKLSSQDEVATKATSIYGLLGSDVVKGVRYSLGSLSSGRQKVTYSYDLKPGAEQLTGGGRVDVWYYPEQMALVSVSLGQSVAFANDSNTTVVYDQDIVDSFKFIK